MSQAGHGNKGDANRVKDHKAFADKLEQVKTGVYKPSKIWETEASQKRRKLKEDG